MKGYSTLQTPDGREKPYYYAPREKVWGESLVATLGRKARALGWVTDVDEDLKGAYVKPQSRQGRPADSELQGFWIKGWTGLYEVNPSEPYFRLAYDAGFGAKNAQGFGMVEVIRERRN